MGHDQNSILTWQGHDPGAFRSELIDMTLLAGLTMRLKTRSAQRLSYTKFPPSGLVQLVAKIHWEDKVRDMLALLAAIQWPQTKWLSLLQKAWRSFWFLLIQQTWSIIWNHFCFVVRSTALAIIKEEKRHVYATDCKECAETVILAFPVLFKPAFQHGLAVHSRSEHQPNINSSNKTSCLLQWAPLCCADMPDITETHLVFYFLAKSWWLPVSKRKARLGARRDISHQKEIKIISPI